MNAPREVAAPTSQIVYVLVGWDEVPLSPPLESRALVRAWASEHGLDMSGRIRRAKLTIYGS